MKLRKKSRKKWLKITWRAIKRMNIKFDIIMTKTPFIFCKLAQFKEKKEKKERWEEKKPVKAQPWHYHQHTSHHRKEHGVPLPTTLRKLLFGHYKIP